QYYRNPVDQHHILYGRSKKQIFEFPLAFRCDLKMLFQWNTLFIPVVHNALLRGEQRNTDAAAFHLKH
ncbi:hypothetical protein, partial [Vibrio parahaemolyticus]|uniref:hypothetical protein n=1 Tax=Vibrio parahaemolyticus TaxID=670 RepID=UPI00358E85C3